MGSKTKELERQSVSVEGHDDHEDQDRDLSMEACHQSKAQEEQRHKEQDLRLREEAKELFCRCKMRREVVAVRLCHWHMEALKLRMAVVRYHMADEVHRKEVDDHDNLHCEKSADRRQTDDQNLFHALEDLLVVAHHAN